MSRHAQLCRPPPIEQLSAQGAPPDLEAETREERPAPAIEPFTTPERTRPLSGPIKEMAPEGVPEIQAGHSTADGPGKTRGKDGFGPAVPRDVPVIGVTENAFTPEVDQSSIIPVT